MSSERILSLAIRPLLDLQIGYLSYVCVLIYCLNTYAWKFLHVHHDVADICIYQVESVHRFTCGASWVTCTVCGTYTDSRSDTGRHWQHSIFAAVFSGIDS